MRYIVCLFLCISLAFSISTKEKINKNKKHLNKTTKVEEKISQKIDEIAKDILKGESALNRTDRQITELENQIHRLEINSKATNIKLESLTRENKKLAKNRKELEVRIVNIIADKFSFYMVMDKNYQESTESIMGNEVLKKMDIILKKDFQELSNAYENTNQTIKKHNNQISKIEGSIKNLKVKQASLNGLKKRREQEVEKLKTKKQAYKKKLEKVVAQRNELQKTLQSLKILKYQEEEEARRDKELLKDDKNYKTTKNGKLSVRQLGSSYQHGSVKSYKGKKTISPLKSYVVKRKFGNYIDPVYKMKIFNESVILRSRAKNAKVRNVLSGKVVFAKDTPMLDKVVIIENKSGIHTIYAHMKKIAPTIRVGKRIKKGYIIGRVERDLTFEVTQKNYHINPLQLIR